MSDRNRMLSLYLNVLDAKSTDEDGIPLPCRATFILAPNMSIQLMHFYPLTTGRNFKYLNIIIKYYSLIILDIIFNLPI